MNIFTHKLALYEKLYQNYSINKIYALKKYKFEHDCLLEIADEIESVLDPSCPDCKFLTCNHETCTIECICEKHIGILNLLQTPLLYILNRRLRKISTLVVYNYDGDDEKGSEDYRIYMVADGENDLGLYVAPNIRPCISNKGTLYPRGEIDEKNKLDYTCKGNFKNNIEVLLFIINLYKSIGRKYVSMTNSH